MAESCLAREIRRVGFTSIINISGEEDDELFHNNESFDQKVFDPETKALVLGYLENFGTKFVSLACHYL